MGLFGKKKECPICGEPTPRLLATKVEDEPICKECAAKIDLPDGALNQMSLEDFREYLQVYEENQVMRDRFKETYYLSFGLFGGRFSMDMNHGMFRLKDQQGVFAMDGTNLRSFRITEDGVPLFEGSKNGLKCHQSSVPERANAMAPEIERFEREMREYRRYENMDKMRRLSDDDPSNDYKNNMNMQRMRPTFRGKPFNKFMIEIYLNHPYWKEFKEDVDAPTFNTDYPNIGTYLKEYDAKAAEMRTLAENLMALMAPGAAVINAGGTMAAMGGAMPVAQAPEAAPAAAPAVDAVEEIKKYKGLLDAGIITEEEFTAKKKQLLGI